MTFPELCLSLIVAALVMGALASFLGAVGQGWTSSSESQRQRATTVRTEEQVSRMVRSALHIGRVEPGSLDPLSASSASALLWEHDGSVAGGVAADGLAQRSELLLIEHDRPGRRLLAYRVRPEANEAVWTRGAIEDSHAAGAFRSGASPRALAHDVASASMTVEHSGSSRKPLLRIELRVESEDGALRDRTILVALRVPKEPPS